MSEPVILKLVTLSDAELITLGIDPILLEGTDGEINNLLMDKINPTVIVPSIPVTGPRGPKGDNGTGLRRNIFIATAGQTEFEVDFDPVLSGNYLVFIDDAKQSRLLFTNVGNIVTCLLDLQEGQVVEIFD